MMTILWLLALTIIMIGLIAGFGIFWRGNSQVLRELQQRLSAQAEHGPALRARIERLEVEMRAVLDRSRQVAPVPSAAPLGAELAPRLAAAGASRDELMRACGMTQEEADLVVRLHGRGET